MIVLRLARDPSMLNVKRVVAGPGDRVEMTDGVLAVNGRTVGREVLGPVTSEGVTYSQIRETLANDYSFLTFDQGTGGIYDTTKAFAVPGGHYFVLGDNRDVSSDSRVPPTRLGLGFIAADSILGRAVVP